MHQDKLNHLFGLGLLGIFITAVARYFNTALSLLVAALLIVLIIKEVITPEFPIIEKVNGKDDPDTDQYDDFHNY